LRASVEKKIKAKYCDDEQSEQSASPSFVQSVKEFIRVLEEENEKNRCDEAMRTSSSVDEICRKTEACAVKKSYNAIVGNYEKDVVEYVYAMDKAVGVVVLDTFTDIGELPEACDFLYKPLNLD
ncbi:hypothetical protein AAVH_34263, partial [Aphelenchoides avenae]